MAQSECKREKTLRDKALDEQVALESRVKELESQVKELESQVKRHKSQLEKSKTTTYIKREPGL
jgi:hypothetical protein